MKQWIPAVLAWSLLSCQAAPPEPPPEPDHLVADVAKLGADLLACEQRENVLLHEKKDELNTKIAAAKEQVAAYRSVIGEAAYRRIVGDGGSR